MSRNMVVRRNAPEKRATQKTRLRVCLNLQKLPKIAKIA